MLKWGLAIGLLASVMITLSGCGPNKEFGPGIIVHLDGNLTYRQDNNWVYATNESWVHSKEMEGQHCDNLQLYTKYDSVTDVIGTNCHDPHGGGCMSYDINTNKFSTTPCPPGFDNQDYHQSHPAEPGSWSSIKPCPLGKAVTYNSVTQQLKCEYPNKP